MPFRNPRLFRAVPLLMLLGCGGAGSDGGPADVPVIVLSQSTLSLTEGTPETLTVVLDAAPQANVSIALASAGRVTVLPTTLEFTPANFATPRSVIVMPLQDADLADGVDTVSATATGLGTVKLPVAIDDNDTQGVIVDTDSLVITEGDTASFTVRLAYQPAGNVTVDFGPLDSNVTVSQPAALFSTGNWDAPIRITVTAHHDSDLGNEATSVVAGIAAGPNAIVNITVDDDDSQAVLVDTDSLTILEGDTASFTVRLAYQPASSVTVDFGPQDSNVTVSQSSALFSTGNWDTPIRVTVTAHHDDDAGDETTFVTAGIAAGPNAVVNITVDDDDTQSIVTVGSIFLAEGGTNTVPVHLAFRPEADFVVSAASSDNLTATASPATLTFTSVNWEDVQHVTMSGTPDNDLANGTVTLTLSGAGVTNKAVTVNVNDDDTQSIVASVDTIYATEGDTADVTITLAFRPASSLSVALTLDSLVANTFSPTLPFTTANWNTGFLVQILGAEDADSVNDVTLLELVGTGGLMREILVIVADNDQQPVIVAPDSRTVLEGDTTSVMVRLAYRPAGPANVNFVHYAASNPWSPDTRLTFSPPLVSFSRSNWATPVRVTITANHDPDTGDELEYVYAWLDGFPSFLAVQVTVDDDD